MSIPLGGQWSRSSRKLPNYSWKAVTDVKYLKVNVEIEYVTTSEPGITRRLKMQKAVATSLALTVNVQDFFRGERYESHSCRYMKLIPFVPGF